MDRTTIKGCLAEVPAEIREAVKPLNNDKAWAIYILLLKREQMRFNEIKKEFRARSSGDIDRYLKALVNAGLVSKRARVLDDLGDKERAYYSPTGLGKSLMHGLFESVLPQPASPDLEVSAGRDGDKGYYDDRVSALSCQEPFAVYGPGTRGRRKRWGTTGRDE
ncbi:MAG: hypothetical protein GX216_08565 [Methanomicrobiales archaeon]|nr:hypothetical protein [Methanomicrobiales archaeon]